MFGILRSLLLVTLLTILPGCSNQTPIKTEPKETVQAQRTLFDEITLEIVAVTGMGPDAGALAFFINKLSQYDIARVVHIYYRSDLKNIYPIWNSALIDSFERLNRRHHDLKPKDRHLVLFVCYLPGIYVEGDKTSIAGLQYGNTSFAVFRENTDASYEGVVLLHEFGHIIRIARAAGREADPINPDRPNHCNNTKCTMFWRAGEHRTELDEECLSELKQLIEKRYNVSER